MPVDKRLRFDRLVGLAAEVVELIAGFEL